MLAIGHRGAAGHAPENTLRSMQVALDFGAPWVELDVYLIENQLLVHHDDTLERCTNGHGYIFEKNLTYLRSLDAGNGEHIPTLEEVFKLINHRAGINIELKGKETASATADFIARQIAKGWAYDKILVSSFNHKDLTKVKNINSKIKIGVLLGRISLDDASIAEDLGAFSIHPSIDYINQKLVSDAHKRGMQVYAYTANNTREFKRMEKLGVDGLFSDYPDRVIAYNEGKSS
jgi:glycerophosphoryl diester phosphodiesterase